MVCAAARSRFKLSCMRVKHENIIVSISIGFLKQSKEVCKTMDSYGILFHGKNKHSTANTRGGGGGGGAKVET